MKYYTMVFALIFLITSCMPANKSALERTNKNVLAIAKHDQNQDKVISALVIKNFGEIPQFTEGLQNESANIAKIAEEETKADVGIFNWDAFKTFATATWETFGDAIMTAVKSSPYGSAIIAGGTLISGLIGKGALDGFFARRKEKVKKEILKRQSPDDAKKYDDLVASVTKEIKEGKIKV